MVCFVDTYSLDSGLYPAVDSVIHLEDNPGQRVLLWRRFSGLESPEEKLLVLEILRPNQILRTYKIYEKCMTDVNEILDVKWFMSIIL